MLAGDHLVDPDLVISVRRTSAPAPITSTRPGCMTGSAARSSWVMASSSSSPRRPAGAVTVAPWIAPGRSGRAPSASAATVVTVPATPTSAAGSFERDVLRRVVATPSRTSRTVAAIWSAVGGSSCRCRSVIRTQPTSMLCAAERPRSPGPRTSSVEPPPMSATSTGPLQLRQAAHRAGERQRGLLGAADHLGIDAEHVCAPSPTNSSRLAASRVALVATMRTASAPCARDQGGVVGRARPGALERLRREPSRCGRRPARAGRCASRGARRSASSSVDVGDQQPDRVRAAVDRGDPTSGDCRRDAWPRRPPRHAAGRAPRRRAGSRPRPAASECATSTCRHFTRFGMPPALMPAISATWPSSSRRREVGLVRRAVAGGQLGVGGQPVGHLAHQPGRLEPADRRGRARAGQVVQRRERACRRAAAARSRRRPDCRTGHRCATARMARGVRPSCAATIARSFSASDRGTGPSSAAPSVTDCPPYGASPQACSSCAWHRGLRCCPGGRRTMSGLLPGVDDDVHRVAGHRVLQPLPRLLLDVARVAPLR